MATETRNKGTIYCTKEQFDTLMSTGSVVIGGQTYTYEDGWQYAVIDKDYVDLTSDQGVQGTKVFGRGNDDTAVVKIGPNDHSQTLISVEGQGPQAGNSVALNPDGIEFTQGGGTTQYLTMPTAGGTIARTEDVKKYYRHRIDMHSDAGNNPPEIVITGTIISSKSTPYTMADFISMGATAFCNFINYNLIGGLNKLSRGSGGGICISLSSPGNTALSMYYISSTNPTYEFVYSYTPTIQLDNTWTLSSYTPEEL